MTERVRAEWARRVAAEYGSAAITAQALTWGIQVGLPAPLLHTATRIVSDELVHAELAQGCLVALGGADTPVEIPVTALVLPAPEGPFPALLATIVRSFCLGETFAVPYFAAMRDVVRHPAPKPVLDRVLQDEAVHRAFGWDALDALLELAPGAQDEVSRMLPGLLATFDGYRTPPDAPALTADERACGLLDHATYAAIYVSTWTDDIVPRFRRRGIVPP